MVLFKILISLFNLMLCTSISIFSYLYYKKNKQITYFLISLAFGLFGLSHVIELSFPLTDLFLFLFLIRSLAYFLIIISLLKIIKIHWYIVSTIFILIGTFLFLSLYITASQRISFINLLFCITIIIIGFLLHKKTKNKIAFFLATAFLFFGLTHLILFLDIKGLITITLLLRFTAYLLIFIASYRTVETQVTSFTLKYFASNKFQMFTVGTAIIIITLMFYFPHFKLNISDPIPKINPITPKTIERQVTEVQTGLYITNFPLFDINNNEFTVNAIVWFEFDPHSISLDSISKFSFEKGTIVEKSDPETKIINGKLFSRFKVKVNFKSDLDYKLFPFEDHKINLILINTFLNSDEVIISSQNTNFTSKKSLFTADWELYGRSVRYGYSVSQVDKYDETKTSTYPTVIYSLDFIKSGFKKTFMIFLPLFLAFLLGIFSLIINIKNSGGILALSVGSVSSLIYDLFIIERMTPNVSYFTISDSILTMLLVSVFIILLFNVYIIKKATQDVVPKKIILIRTYLFLFFVVFIPLLTYHFLYFGKA